MGVGGGSGGGKNPGYGGYKYLGYGVGMYIRKRGVSIKVLYTLT